MQTSVRLGCPCGWNPTSTRQTTLSRFCLENLSRAVKRFSFCAARTLWVLRKSLAVLLKWIFDFPIRLAKKSLREFGRLTLGRWSVAVPPEPFAQLFRVAYTSQLTPQLLLDLCFRSAQHGLFPH